MEHLSCQISIDAPKAEACDIMLDPVTYKQWVKAFPPDSQYEGEWTEGSYITFFDPNMGGTKAVLETVTPGERIFARHVAILGTDGSNRIRIGRSSEVDRHDRGACVRLPSLLSPSLTQPPGDNYDPCGNENGAEATTWIAPGRPHVAEHRGLHG